MEDSALDLIDQLETILHDNQKPYGLVVAYARRAIKEWKQDQCI